MSNSNSFKRPNLADPRNVDPSLPWMFRIWAPRLGNRPLAVLVFALVVLAVRYHGLDLVHYHGAQLAARSVRYHG